ncbi:unnamed protein product [Coffea canephora]|uniref:Uncharacterized protein n=1 Tax=Coffea canephora TaxID=49390 RepID=A0A068UPT0_COFCA|nr:unnamed protein product [Coffea canephora]
MCGQDLAIVSESEENPTIPLPFRLYKAGVPQITYASVVHEEYVWACLHFFALLFLYSQLSSLSLLIYCLYQRHPFGNSESLSV